MKIKKITFRFLIRFEVNSSRSFVGSCWRTHTYMHSQYFSMYWLCINGDFFFYLIWKYLCVDVPRRHTWPLLQFYPRHVGAHLPVTFYQHTDLFFFSFTFIVNRADPIYNFQWNSFLVKLIGASVNKSLQQKKRLGK